MLCINCDGLAAGELRQVDPMSGPPKTKLNTVMHQSLPLQSISNARLHQKVDGALLEHAGANSLLDVVALMTLQNNRFDSLKVQKMRKHQARGTRSDNSDLRSHQLIASLFQK